jgi:hypothetical protein
VKDRFFNKQLIFLLIFLLSHPVVAMKNKTLANSDHAQNVELVTLVDSISQGGATEDFYASTMPLLANAILGNKDKTLNIMQKMLSELGLKDVSTNHFKSEQSTEVFLQHAKANPLPFAQDSPVASWSWLLGRVLVAAHRVDDPVTATNTAELMINVLSSQPLPNDPFHAWTWGYLLAYYASSSLTEYELYKQTMLDVSEAYTREAVRDPDNLSDLLWVHVMTLQGPALAHDTVTSQFILNQIVVDAKQMGLPIGAKDPFPVQLVQALKGIKQNDYRAWAMSLVKFAFAVIGDKEGHQSLIGPVAQAIAMSSHKEDKVLAMANDFLSHVILESRKKGTIHTKIAKTS